MPDVLLVVGAAGTLTADDTWLQNRLIGLGYTVVPFTASGSVPANVESLYAGVVFSTSMLNNQAGKWDATLAPIVSASLEKYLHTNQATQNFVATGDTRTTRWCVPHGSNGNRAAGAVTVYGSTPATGYKWLDLPKWASGVAFTGYHDSSLSRVCGIAIDTGAALTSGTCPSRRACPPLNLWSGIASADGADLFDDAVLWAFGPILQPPGIDVQQSTETTVTLDASGSTGVAPLTYAFEQIAGPAVVLNVTGGVCTFDAPGTWSQSITIVVTVTGDDGAQTSSSVVVPPPGGGVRKRVFNGSTWS